MTRPTHNGYIPELAEAIDRHRDLTDGARRTFRVIAAQVYRKRRAQRMLPVTVPWLMKATGRSRRSIQRDLRQLEAAGFIAVDVVPSSRTRMCIGLVVTLMKAALPGHGWPQKAMNPAAPFMAQIYRTGRYILRIPADEWAFKCIIGKDRVRAARLGLLTG